MGAVFAFFVALHFGLLPAQARVGEPHPDVCTEIPRHYPDSFEEEIRTPFVAGQLAGTVEHSSNPIPGVAVELVDEHGKCLKVSLTDPQGHFDLRISKPGEYHLLVSKDYYAILHLKVKITATSKRRLRIKLSLSA